MSDMSAIPRTQRITIRLPTETLADLDERAESNGASRSDYLRTLIALGLEIDVNAIRRTRRGIDELAPIKHSDTGLTLEIDNPPGTVLAVTDEALDAIRAEVNSIGVNYNQAVRSLNRFGKKYSRNKHLTDTERSELQELLDLTGNRMRLVYRRAMELSAKTDTLLEKPSVRLEVKMRPIDRRPPLVGEGQKQAPDNKSPESKNTDQTASTPQPAGADPKRRHRVRGKKKRHDGVPVQPSVSTVSKPKTGADLLHPGDKPTAAESTVPRHPVAPSDSALRVRTASTPSITKNGVSNGRPALRMDDPAPGRATVTNASAPEGRSAATAGSPEGRLSPSRTIDPTPADADASGGYRFESRASDRFEAEYAGDQTDRFSHAGVEDLDAMMEAKAEEADIDIDLQKHRRI